MAKRYVVRFPGQHGALFQTHKAILVLDPKSLVQWEFEGEYSHVWLIFGNMYNS